MLYIMRYALFTMPSDNIESSEGLKWNTVTWYSRLGAIILFIGVLPALSFYIGAQHRAVQDAISMPVVAGNVISSGVSSAQEQSSDVQDSGTAKNVIFSDSSIESQLTACFDTPESSTTPDGSTTVGMDACLGTALTAYKSIEKAQFHTLENKIAADQKSLPIDPVEVGINKYYQDARTSLISAENDWNKYQNALCRVDADAWTDGSGAGGAYLSCQIQLFKVHIQDIKDTFSLGIEE